MAHVPWFFRKHSGFRFPWSAWPLVVRLGLGIGCLLQAGAAYGAETTAHQAQMEAIPAAEIFTFLFLMLGPFKVIGPFAKITRGADVALTRRLAFRASLYAGFGLLLAAFVGESILTKYKIPLPVLALTAGIIFFLVALQATLQQFAPPTGNDGETPAPTMNMALTPIAFPTIVTPYGIAALIIFVALSPDIEGKLIIGALLLAIMLLNVVAMLSARYILRFMGVFLHILGAVLGIVQVALGLQIIVLALRKL